MDEAHGLLVAKLRFATRAPKLKLKLLEFMSGGRWPRKLELLRRGREAGASRPGPTRNRRPRPDLASTVDYGYGSLGDCRQTHGADMERTTLRDLKRQAKCLRGLRFMPLRRGKLPRPFDKQGGARLSSSGLVEVAPGLCVLFIARDDEQLL